MLVYLLGEVRAVQGSLSSAVRGFEVEDTGAALLEFAGGTQAVMTVSDTTVSPWCWDFCAGEQSQYPRQHVQSHFLSGTHGSIDMGPEGGAGGGTVLGEGTPEQLAKNKASFTGHYLARLL